MTERKKFLLRLPQKLHQELKGWADHYGFTYQELYSPDVNLWIARQLRDSSNGWYHWNPYANGKCR